MDEGSWSVWSIRFQLRRQYAEQGVEPGVEEWSAPTRVRVLGDGDALVAVEKLKAHVLASDPMEDDEGQLMGVVEFRLLSVRPVGVVNLK